MKKIIFAGLFAVVIMASMSFLTMKSEPIQLINTKWIGPLKDNCYDLLCFTSDQTVMYYRCAHDLTMEIGYTMQGDIIEIDAFSSASMEHSSKLILMNEKGILRQSPEVNTLYPDSFIKVPAAVCEE